MSEKSSEFLQRADEHIELANNQLNSNLTLGEVSASLMYASTRFSTWMAATSFETAGDMEDAKSDIIEYFAKEYKLALEEHINNHIATYKFSNNKL